MSDRIIDDQEARDQALNTNLSYIVQAPAGSGKTGLLTQRFIALLATVNAPEEIIAITFTIKAAAEMRNRILQALESTVDVNPPDNDYEKKTWQLAKQALKRDKELGWNLLENPTRLRIQTIDSLCASLNRQMPVLSRFGSVPSIANDATALYVEAANNTIAELEGDSEWSLAIEQLLKHLDNNQEKIQSLIVTMLAKRDQWLRHIIHSDNPDLDRENLEAAIQSIITAHLTGLLNLIPKHYQSKLTELASFATNHLPDDSTSNISELNITELPKANVDELKRWLGIAELLLLTSKSNITGTYWRTSIKKDIGFPAKSSTKDSIEKELFQTKKDELTELIQSLSDVHGLHDQLLLVRDLPQKEYKPEEWLILQALLKVLRLAVINLELVFKTQGKVDFTALSLAALHALGHDENPTDLALALDYQIQHLLVDEFQDTAFNQDLLLKKLTAGWQQNDGRTLFCVGDPMQSIYGFREANVGLFLNAKENGIGQVKLNFLNLTVNFRSQAGIVDWVNKSFSDVLPNQDNATKGAVSYAKSTAFHPPLNDEAVSVFPSFIRDDEAEAQQVTQLVQNAISSNPDDTVAVIVRSRSHLTAIIVEFKKARLSFQAVEIEKLAHKRVIQDLLALTRALNHRADRIAWLSILRAPFCGLSLNDLLALVGEDLKATVIELLHQQERVNLLSEEGKLRLSRILPILDAALNQQDRNTHRNRIESVWLSLGGPSCVKNSTELKDAEVYLQLLDDLTHNSNELDLNVLNEQVEKMFALPDVEANGKLQLLTMHKSKGLEFDTVILPGLGRTPPSDQSKLLHWLEVEQSTSEKDLVLAPISPAGEKPNEMVKYLKKLDDEKRHYEDGRLLYVAATRARKRLFLLGHSGVKENRKDGSIELVKPSTRSLLGSLWPAVKNDFQLKFDTNYTDIKAIISNNDENSRDNIEIATSRHRLTSEWVLPEPPQSLSISNAVFEKEPGEQIEFSWAGEIARSVGTVVHRFLQRIGEVGVENVTKDTIKQYENSARLMLLRLGVPKDHLDSALDKVHTALLITINDTKGQWALSNQHQQARCEYAVSGVFNRYVRHMVIDRTFIDEHGIRWIIDYKTGFHSGGNLEEYLDREQERYRSQLSNYAEVLGKVETNPIRLALYFPMMAAWREWSA